MLHELLRTWFTWVEQWGYAGVFILMAMESSIFPVPSELVMPPAAFWAAQGRMSFAGVILAGTAGSLFGSVATYLAAQWLGRPFISRYGKYFFISPEKEKLAEQWVLRHGAAGIFFARLLPVIRHLISIPAGLLRMPLMRFSIVTTVGAGIWCSVLAFFGARALGDHPEVLQSPEQMIIVIKAQMHWILAGVLLLGGLYIVYQVVIAKRIVPPVENG